MKNLIFLIITMLFFSCLNENKTDLVSEEKSAEEEGQDSSGESALEAYATNLNGQAKKGLIDPLIGRAPEIERVIQILSRRRKNNPLLVGESGVGKTAIAEGLAKMMLCNRLILMPVLKVP